MTPAPDRTPAREAREARDVLLDVDGLTVEYGTVKALRGVSLQVLAGELLAVVGPNGAGKSTLLMTIAGGLRPRSGSVRFDGRDITRTAAEDVARAGLSLVPEGRHIFGRLTVEENLRVVPLGTRARRRQQLDKVYELFPVLGEKRRRIAGHLSGGQQQQLAIARALMGAPRLLLLDEPSLGLAPALVDTVFETVDGLRRSGTTVVLVEQRLHQSLRIADRAYVLNGGRLRYQTADLGEDARSDIVDAYFATEREGVRKAWAE
ncbi:ABC transporter ATP-binding protein [Actinomadura geliboluensis]|uniref:ABC transporter ATP-binding protein n=1 Tax=Actinomadura geliboluensis TaxID=882440 RepID=A0A5S4H1U0_9ACTN|nr:ABC transporter ATP-binding protein [Actinomadura geliboluensis]TMR38661.1 ABC transporter ATP-binding protein [Actinomadura geliboluensis]